MQPEYFPGAWYIVADPSGYRAVLYAPGGEPDDAYMVVNGVLINPERGRLPLYPDMTIVDGRLRVAGQGWIGGEAVEWEAMKGWTIHPVINRGNNGVIYDSRGILHVEISIEKDGQPAPIEGLVFTDEKKVGSQGWRYVDAEGNLVTGDATYAPSADAPRLFEWTVARDLVIGQGDQGGIWIWDRTNRVHRVLIAGPASCRNIKVKERDGRVAISWWGEKGVATGAVFTTLEQLRTLPLLVDAPSTPAPIPLPPSPPLPTPVPDEQLAITIHEYEPRFGVVPLEVDVQFEVTGHRGRGVEVFITVDGKELVGADFARGRLIVRLEEPGEYRIGALVRCGDQTRQTGALRLVRAVPAPTPIPPPEPIKTGRDGYTQAGEEARRELGDPGDLD